MSAPAVIAWTFALIALSAFFVVIEFALLGARRHRLENRAAEDASARAALRGMNELTIMLAGAQLGITACTFALGAITKPFVDGWLGPVLLSWGLPEWLAGGAAFALSLLIVTFLHLVIGEMAPKSWAISHPELAARIIGIPSRAFVWPLRPFLRWVNRIANVLVRRSGFEPVDKAAVGGRDADTIRHLVEHSAQVGVLEQRVTRQITDVLALESLTAGGLIAPDARPTVLPSETSVADVQSTARSSGHLRIVLLGREGEASSVVHVRDTLLAAAEDPAARYARPVLRVDLSTPAHDILRRMRRDRVQFAVVEEEGRFMGVLTLTDVLQRILPQSV